MASWRLRIEGQKFRDSESREVTLRGINVACDAKFPSSPDIPSHIAENFFDGDEVSFVGRPFLPEEAHEHFSRLKKWGYNFIRYITTWEAIEHAGPGQYDEEWIQHTIEILRLAKKFGFYVMIDPHQDVWSRFSGGSGAPLWTLYAVGLNPRNFASTEAAFVHNTYPDPAQYPKMIWATNYTRFVCQVVFTLFFGGRHFASKAIIDGKNIQDYLQDHFVAAYRHLAARFHEAGDIENDVVIGWESMNEPNRGLIGWQDLRAIPDEQKFRRGTTPTAWQAILTASGRSCEIDTWDFGSLGPYKSGTELVDPKGESAWLPSDYDDSRYGWKRNPGWKLGECIWAQHGVWDPINDELLIAYYFANDPATGKKMDYEWFTNTYFMDHYRKYRTAITSVNPAAILFLQPPVLEIPPTLSGTPDDDPNMVFVPHYYDGLTLLSKKWNRYWNVDVFGLLRGRYLSPILAIKVGETAIRNCFRDQLAAIRKEGIEYMGNHPCVFSEIGIPFDMDDKHAYKTGDYSSQSSAMDANHFALEGSGVNGYALWVYMSKNSHQWGDFWNGEDLSIFSVDDLPLPSPSSTNNQGPTSTNTSTFSIDKSSPSFSQSLSSAQTLVSPTTLKKSLSTPSISSQNSKSPTTNLTGAGGYRAAEAFVRPSPIATSGTVTFYGFDLRHATFTFTLDCDSPTTEAAPTEIFLPEFHFPPGDRTEVTVSGGKWTISLDGGVGDNNRGTIQKLRWWHGEGVQNMTVKGVARPLGTTTSDNDEAGYYEQCQPANCIVM